MIFKCKVCGATEKTAEWRESCARELRKHRMCFSCNHWRNQMKWDKERGRYGYAIIDGSHYVLKPHAEGYPSGLCGATNLIKFNDGHEVACDNLWFQGEIPDCWKDRMPDNAKFV